MLSHVGNEVDPGDMTLLNCLLSPSGSGLMFGSPGVELARPLPSLPGVFLPGAVVLPLGMLLLPLPPAGFIARQLACESITTSSVSMPLGVLEEFSVFRIAHMY